MPKSLLRKVFFFKFDKIIDNKQCLNMSFLPLNSIKYIKVFVWFFVLISTTSNAQVKSLLQSHDKLIDDYVVDQYQIDLPKERREIVQNDLSYQFAVPVEPNYPITLPANIAKTADSFHYLLKITAEDAYALNFTLNGLMDGLVRSVYVKNLNSGEVFGPYNPVKNKFDITAFPVFFSSKILVEIVAEEKLKPGTVHLHRLGITYEKNSFPGSGDCNVDINCDEGLPWQGVKNAVARIMYDNGWLCSGTLINTTRNDSTPYFLTANHCVGSEFSAANTVFYFKYESLYCDGAEDDYPDLNAYTLSGSELKATKYDSEGKLDFTLLEISEKVPDNYDPYYVGWNASEDTPGATVGIHHPKGDVKKICIDYDSPVTSHFAEYDQYSFWRIITWDVGVTEGGSSGSGLFNANFQLVGTLTGGEATCDNPVNDYYLKFSKAFNQYNDSTEQLKYWLDPKNENVTYWYGWPLEDEEGGDEYRIGPNPVDHNLTVFNQNLEGNVAVKIWDIRGELTWQRIYLDVNSMIVIDIPEQLDGLHILQIKTNNKTITQKLIIQ